MRASLLALRSGKIIVISILTILLITFFTFLVFAIWPANPAQLACGKPCTPDRLALANAFMGYDQSWFQQFYNFVTGVFTGRTFSAQNTQIVCDAPCLGYSFRLSEPVTNLIASRFPITLSMVIGAAILWLVTGVVFGTVAAMNRGNFIDKFLMALSVTGISAPAYLVGLIAIMVFGFYWQIIPVAGYVQFSEDPLGWALHLVGPWIILALLFASLYARLVRAELVEVLNKEWIISARAKGVSEKKVMRKHALRAVTPSVFTLFALDVGGLLGGAVITEQVFSLGGLGALLMEGVKENDLPLIVGLVVLGATFVVIANAIVDMVQPWLDPRTEL